MYNPGDVISFHSNEAGKRKYHLCVSIGGYYLFLNSPKAIQRATDFKLDGGYVPYLPPTAEGYSIVSCSFVMLKSSVELQRSKAIKLGVIPKPVMLKLFEFIEACEAIEGQIKHRILSELGDWL